MTKNKHKNNWTRVTIAIAILLCIFFVYKYFPDSSSKIGTNNKNSTTSGLETYTDDTYSFSFNYPSNLHASAFPAPDGSGDVVVVVGESTSTGFQIYITPANKQVNILTADQIRKSLPKLSIIQPQNVLLGSEGKGVAFMDNSNPAIANRQIWFVAAKNLYQITAPMTFDNDLKTIISSWKFF